MDISLNCWNGKRKFHPVLNLLATSFIGSISICENNQIILSWSNICFKQLVEYFEEEEKVGEIWVGRV